MTNEGHLIAQIEKGIIDQERREARIDELKESLLSDKPIDGRDNQLTQVLEVFAESADDEQFDELAKAMWPINDKVRDALSEFAEAVAEKIADQEAKQ